MEQVNRTYQIYALVDPRNELIRYVGISVNAQVRYHGYLTGRYTTKKQKAWLEDLKQQNISPILRILETIEASDRSYVTVRERELYWIEEIARTGQPLLNFQGIQCAYPTFKGKIRRIPTNRKKNMEIKTVKSEPETKPADTTYLMSQSQEKMLTVKQVADRMSIDERTVRGWIQKGELKAVNIGGRLRPEYRIRPDDLEEFIKGRETDGN